MEVCMQCHLETASLDLPHSIRRFERAPFSYRAGEPLGQAAVRRSLGRVARRGRWPRHRGAINAVAIVLVVWVGLCLVYLGAHWTTDVIAGWLLGAAIGWGIVAVSRSRFRQTSPPLARPTTSI